MEEESNNCKKPEELSDDNRKIDEKSDDIEKPEEMLEDIVNDLDEIHKILIDEAENIGYARDSIRSTIPIWKDIGDAKLQNLDDIPVVTSGLTVLSALHDEVKEKKGIIGPLPGLLIPTTNSIRLFLGATGTTAGFSNPASMTFIQNPLSDNSPERYKSYSDRFKRFNPSLGKTYLAISEALYVTRSDPERSALYLIRQAFDTLFSILAPDEEVRKSSSWKEKTVKGKENQVFRDERIKYALLQHVKDHSKKKILFASSTHMEEVYKSLNRAHDRGILNQELARKALFEMQSILEEWADALEI